MKVWLGWGGIRSLGIYRSNAAAFTGSERTVNQPGRNVIAVIRLLRMYLERSAHISAEFVGEERKEGGEQTEEERNGRHREGEINTTESCDVTPPSPDLATETSRKIFQARIRRNSDPAGGK